MSVGWKFDAGSFALDTSAGVTAVQRLFADTKYVTPGGAQTCGNIGGGALVASLQESKGYVQVSWNAVADLTTGGDISGIEHSLMANPQTFKGNVHYQIKDANGALLVNKAYNKKDMETIDDQAAVDSWTVLVDAVTYDPNLAQYATLAVSVSFSGVLPNISIGGATSNWC